MHEFRFTAIGTEWSITTDGSPISEVDRSALLEHIDVFEKRYSRFLSDSEVNSFRNAAPGRYAISKELADMLVVSKRLGELTDGRFDPAVTGLLEQAGYDAEYSMREKRGVAEFTLPRWEIDKTILALEEPAVFDIGGIGKGYCIDKAVTFLYERGYERLLVDAGGDMHGTTKADNSPWRVAIQYPGKPDTAAGVVELNDQALAVSDTFRRRWGAWHHIVDPKQKRAVDSVTGAAALAPSAFYADCMTSVCFLGRSQTYKTAADEFAASYLVFRDDGTCLASPDWPGELFT